MNGGGSVSEAYGGGGGAGGARHAFSSATLDELESQNDAQVGVLTGKVRMLKDVRCLPPFPPFLLLPQN
jgi:blocked-early-in-transport protein 1